jgi:chromosome segregation protein
VVVQSHDHAAAGLQFVRAHNAGRVGFVVAADMPDEGPVDAPAVDLIPLSQVVRVGGPAAAAIRAAVARVWIARSYDSARVSASTAAHAYAAGTRVDPIVTIDGEVFRGAHVVEGGSRAEARGILTTKREIKELRERAEVEGASVERLRDELVSLDAAIAGLDSDIVSVQGEIHRQEKAVVGYELQLANTADAIERINRKRDQIATERRSAEEELRTQAARQDEARASIARIETEQHAADGLLNAAQRRLFDAREATQAQALRTSEAKASHAGLVERASALAAEVQRLEESARELEERVATRRDDLSRTHSRRTALLESITASEATLDASLRVFDELRERVRDADQASQALRAEFEQQEIRIRDARRALEGVRAEAGQLEVARATAESDLSHLAASCVESVQASLDEVASEVAELERQGVLASPKPVDDRPDAVELDAEGGATELPTAEGGPTEARPDEERKPMTPDEMVADLRAKLERMGAVNMMAIDQFDDLESRHAFLTAQRKDLIDSIAATGEAIRKIDKTTKERFREAFTVINQNFEETFKTLFGGGRAGLVLLDESDQLESGIDIIAQPPGKRLQSVQLLSGGEKALTAMALMFAIFKYRPSPFCLLDEIDAPLDDANIGRFVEMLQGMQEHTQFILITHNRKTMEIADRLYGVTMEEPGVSKLISVQLN